ncbi:hypothetical protein KSW81_006039 [Nannochloris sp. 'desiccata']|nr:hypothetical protein KSW81_006039 [Chlorella desiccata (nom. nud.)]
MASSPAIQNVPEGTQGQKKNSSDQLFDRKPKARFHVFSPAPSTESFSTNCIKVESAIADAINAVNNQPRRLPRVRVPEQDYMALSIRGGQKIPRDVLASALSSAQARLCFTLPLRGHGLQTVSMNDSLAIIKCLRPPKTITIGDKPVLFYVITPVNPEVPSANPPRGSYAAAAAGAPRPPAAFQIQAWNAIQEARLQKLGDDFTGTTTATGHVNSAPSAAAAAAAKTAVATGTAAAGDTAAGKDVHRTLTVEKSKENGDSGNQIDEDETSLRDEVGMETVVNRTAEADVAPAMPDGANVTAAAGGGNIGADKEEGELVVEVNKPNDDMDLTNPRSAVEDEEEVDEAGAVATDVAFIVAKEKNRGLSSQSSRVRPPESSPPSSEPVRNEMPLFPTLPRVGLRRRASNTAAAAPDSYKPVRGLSLVSHNVRGLSVSKLADLLPLWDKLHADVVCIQEHHIRNILETPPLNNLLGSRPSGTGWKPLWRFNESGASSSNRGSAGVAFLIRSHLLRDELIKIDGGGGGNNFESAVRSWSPANQEDGRSISVDISWAGHKLTLACVYLPNHSVDRTEFINTRIVPLKKYASSKGRQLVMAGDFNFVHDPYLDRLTVHQGVVGNPTSQSVPTANEWSRHHELDALVDVWRAQHPSGRYLSWMQNGAAARLDRFYMDREVSAYAQCPSKLPKDALGRALYKSDHAPVVCCLFGRSSQAETSGPTGSKRQPRLNISFMKDQALAGEFADWLESKLETMPSSDRERISWWTKFKSKVLRWEVFKLNGKYFQSCLQKHSYDKLLSEAGDVLTALNGSDPAARSEAMSRFPALKSEIATAEAELEAFKQTRERRAWIHHKERPSRALSYALLQRKQEDIAALQDDSGVVHTARSKCADMAMKFWAGISSQPETNAEARAQVLAALAADSLPQIDVAAAQQLGSQTITVDELLQTLKKSSPHTASGPDGIPMKLYKRFKDQFAPMLAAVFSAFGKLQRVPRRFLDSIITHIFKAGSRLKIGDHRPISLTNTEYRLLTRALAGRLGGVLQDVIDPAQTAFLRGRNIGDNAMLLQILPAWLNQQNRSGLIAFCDIRKAYDTVDRQFLFEAAKTIGLGNGFVNWMKLLLTDTRSAALVDGYLSDYHKMEAGVRQGCPLAPLLYLLIAQAVLSWLKSKGIGITVLSELLTAGQHADDLKALLEGPEEVPTFIVAMKIFAMATGQHMLPAKTKLLPIGKVPEVPLPEQIEGLPVVSSAKALGLTFSAYTGEVSVDWSEMIKKVHERVSRIVKCKLSPFGRAFAMNGYALSRILFAAQFVGLPAGTQLNYLQSMIAAAVDSGTCLRLPGETGPSQRHFTHVSKELLVGHPKHGGMGLMDLPTHITSMHQKWACRLLTGNANCPWIKLARAVLSNIIDRSETSNRTPYTAPRLHFLCAILEGLDTYFSPRNGHIPLCLRQMADALAALPPLKIVASLVPGPWCSNTPIWSNPILLDSTNQPLERGTSALNPLNGRGIASLGDLLKARMELEAISPEQFFRTWKDLTYPGRPNDCPLDSLPHKIFFQHRTIPAVAAILDAAIVEMDQKLPVGWLDAAQYPGTALVSDTEDLILSSMGWTFKNRKILLKGFSVKMGTILQVTQREPPQKAKMEEFAKLVSEDTPLQAVQRMFARIWQLPCDGNDLAPLWYLVLNGCATAERMNSLANLPCGCQTCNGPTRLHAFFDCPIVQPLLQSILKQLQGDGTSPLLSLQRNHIWLAAKPITSLHQGIWDIVVVFTVKSMEAARRNWTDRALKAQQRKRQPRRSSRAAGSRHRPPMPPGPEMITSVGAVALTEFWGCLTDFIAIKTLPSQWLSVVPLDHPFFHPDPERRTWVISRQE